MRLTGNLFILAGLIGCGMMFAKSLQWQELRNYKCIETLDRYHDGQKYDHARFEVSFESGREEYSGGTSVDSLGRACTLNDFGSPLRFAEDRLTMISHFDAHAQPKTTPYSVFEVAANEKQWGVMIRGKEHFFPFTVHTTQDSQGRIIDLAEQTDEIPSKLGIRQISWHMHLAERVVDGDIVLLPASVEYIVAYKRGGLEQNVITFDEYKRYAAESRLVGQ